MEPAHSGASIDHAIQAALERGRRMRTNAVLGVILAGLVLAPQVVLAGHMKPGMWKVTTVVDLGAAAPKIPPEMLARMQSMGIKLPGSGQDITTQQCVTPDMAAKDVPPRMGRDDSGCTSQNEKVSASSMSANLVCSGSMKGQGTMQITYADPDHYTGLFTFQGTAVGHPVDLKSTFTGERVSDDCK
jgi:uncharacterized protein DUF3617